MASYGSVSPSSRSLPGDWDHIMSRARGLGPHHIQDLGDWHHIMSRTRGSGTTSCPGPGGVCPHHIQNPGDWDHIMSTTREDLGVMLTICCLVASSPSSRDLPLQIRGT